MKVLFCGSRDWRDWSTIHVALKQFDSKSTIVIHGDCYKGVDKMVDFLARKFGFSVQKYPANWDRFGNSAGPIRNQQMLDENKDIDLVIAFPLVTSKGTWDMINRAKRAGIKVKIMTLGGDKNA